MGGGTLDIIFDQQEMKLFRKNKKIHQISTSIIAAIRLLSARSSLFCWVIHLRDLYLYLF